MRSPQIKCSSLSSATGASLLVSLVILLLIVVAVGILFYKKEGILQGVTSLAVHREQPGSVTLFFGEERSDFLMRESRRIKTAANPEEMARIVLTELIRGPSGTGIRTVPQQTRVLSVKMEQNGLMKVNLGQELLRYHPGGSTAEVMTVYSIVNTLTENIKDVKMVQLLFDGNTIETIAGHIDISKPLNPQPDLVH
jgi:spore germination protein GerM